MDATYDKKVFQSKVKEVEEEKFLEAEEKYVEHIKHSDLKTVPMDSNLYILLTINRKRFIIAIVVTMVIGVLIGAQIVGMVFYGMYSNAKTSMEKEYSEKISSLSQELETSKKEAEKLSASNSDLKKTLDISQKEYNDKLSEVNNRLDKIKKYENLLLSGNIEKLNLSSLSTNQKIFIYKLIPVALQEYIDKNTLPSVTIAQAIHESRWGNSLLTQNANNLFGFKAGDKWSGKTYMSKTKEHDSNGNEYTVIAKFRAYDNYSESIKDYTRVISTSRNYEGVNKTRDYKVAVRKIVNGNYASDPDYYSKVVGAIESYNLYLLDSEIRG